MIPYPPRIRATRRWAAGESSAVALLVCGAGVLLSATWLGWTVAPAVAMLAWTLIYRFETAVVRRRLALMRRAFPAGWNALLVERVPYCRSLDDAERLRFQQLVSIFLAEKPILGVGCVVDDACRLLVAASAIIPIFAFPTWEYTMLRKVLVRPESFDAEFRRGNGTPLMAQGMVGRSGLLDGVMILSLPDLLAGFSPAAGRHNVGIHEFAHLLDQADGAVDGIPATLPRECLRPWTTLVHEHLAHHSGADAGIPAYGYTSEVEFFAVVSEYFFQSPQELADRDPELYALLERVFHQDLLGRRRFLA